LKINSPFFHFLGVLFVSLCWGMGGPVCFFVTQTLSAAETTFGRCAFAFLGLSPFFFTNGIKGFMALSTRGKALLASSGTLLGIHFYFFVSGIAHASLATAVTLVAVEPVLILAVGVLGFKERLTRSSKIGVFSCLVGMVLISVLPHLISHSQEVTHDRTFGDVCAVLAVLTYALYYGLNRSLKPEEDRLPGAPSPLIRGFGFASVLYLFAAISSGSICYLTQFKTPFTHPAPGHSVWLALIALGFIPTILGHTLNQILSRVANPVWISLMSPGETLISISIGWILLNQTLRPFDALGGMFILAGVLITLRGELKTANPIPSS
jgi:drug/metabolite transporter (DMT)-like permease